VRAVVLAKRKTPVRTACIELVLDDSLLLETRTREEGQRTPPTKEWKLDHVSGKKRAGDPDDANYDLVV